MDIMWSAPHPLVTAEYRAAIFTHTGRNDPLFDLNQSAWEREMAALPDDGVTYVVEGEARA
jgi:hypothetical protein